MFIEVKNIYHPARTAQEEFLNSQPGEFLDSATLGLNMGGYSDLKFEYEGQRLRVRVSGLNDEPICVVESEGSHLVREKEYILDENNPLLLLKRRSEGAFADQIRLVPDEPIEIPALHPKVTSILPYLERRKQSSSII